MVFMNSVNAVNKYQHQHHYVVKSQWLEAFFNKIFNVFCI